MAPSPRLLVVLALGLAPGCLTVHGTTVSHADQPAGVPAPKGDQFASLRPGEAIQTKPPADPKTTAEKPTAPKLTPPDADPIAPLPPENVLAVKGGAPDPGQLPVGIVPPPEPPLLAAMRAYVENRPDDAIRHLEKLDRPNQEFALA